MSKTKPSKQLSHAEIDRFLTAAEALHKSIVGPLLSPTSDHYRSTRTLHEALLKAVRDVTGKEVEFIQWNTTGGAAPYGSVARTRGWTANHPPATQRARRVLA